MVYILIYALLLTLNTQFRGGLGNLCGLEELCSGNGPVKDCPKAPLLGPDAIKDYKHDKNKTSPIDTLGWLEKEYKYGEDSCAGAKETSAIGDHKVFCGRRFGDSEKQMYCTNRTNELKRMCAEGELCMFPCEGSNNWIKIYKQAPIPKNFTNFTLEDWRVFLIAVGQRYCISGGCKRDYSAHIENDNIQYICTGDYKKCAEGEMCQLPCRKPPDNQTRLPDTDLPLFAVINGTTQGYQMEELWDQYVGKMGTRFCSSGKCKRKDPDKGDNTMICLPSPPSKSSKIISSSTLGFVTIVFILLKT